MGAGVVETGVLVGLGVTIAVGVLVGKPLALFVKMASVTPVPILTTTFPIARFLLTARLFGRTSMRATIYPAGMTSWTVTFVLSGNCPASTQKPSLGPAGTL